jgi:cytochrome c biogenesis protein CcdA/glutaredoxin
LIQNDIKKILYLVILVSVISLIVLPGKKTVADTTEPTLNLYFFYNNPCASCNEEGKFYDKFNSIVGKEKYNISYNIIVYDYIKAGSEMKFKELCDKYKVPEKNRIMPMLFIGDTYLSGNDDIDNRLKDEFINAKEKLLKSNSNIFRTVKGSLLNLTPNVNKINETSADSSIVLKASERTDTVILYFYVSSCSDCSELEKVLDKLKPMYDIEIDNKKLSSKVKLLKYNVGEPENLNLIKQYFKAYNVALKDQKMPLLFIGGKYMAGGETKPNEIENLINIGEGTTTLLPVGGHWEVDVESLSSEGYSFAGVFLTGLINGLNPCSLSMLLFFLSLLLTKSINVLKYGIAFIVGKFIAYISLGTIAYRLLLLIDGSYINGFQLIIKILLLTLVGVLALANIRDYFAAKDEKYNKIIVQLPTALRRVNHRWIRKLTATENMKLLLFMCFMLGIGISVGEFLCTGQIYLATIIYVMKSSPDLNLKAFAAFTTYVAAMMTPLLLITATIYKGREIFDISEAIRKRMHVIKAINAVIFVIVAIIIFFLF